MAIIFDIVDLLQLQELWGRRPIITAYTRLEQRQTSLACAFRFNVDELIPRLSRLKNSPIWRSNRDNLTNDPARIPMGSLTEENLSVLFPETDSPTTARQQLFTSVYNHFVVVQYRADIDNLQGALRTLVQVRDIEPADLLDAADLPRAGAADWIPADMTDEIRSLDTRYNATEPGTPATYVVSDDFWTILVKTTPSDVDEAANRFCQEVLAPCVDDCRQQLTGLVEVAQIWNRSPSVVGLCYQVFP